MYCSDFIFNGESLSDYGFIICNIGGSSSSWSGGDVTFTTVKPPSSNKFHFHGASFNEPISFSFQIGLNHCDHNDGYLTQEHASSLMRWLQRTDNYHWLSFCQDGWEDIWFHSQINLQPVYIGGRIAGYDVTVTTDSPYGYSQPYKIQSFIQPGETFNLKDYSDLPGHLYPVLTIIPKGNGILRITTGCNEYKRVTEIKDVIEDVEIVLDGNNDLILGVDNLNNFNFTFPVISNTYRDINNKIINNSNFDLDITIEWRYVRRVAV